MTKVISFTACRYDVSKTHVKPEREDMTKVISLLVRETHVNGKARKTKYDEIKSV